MRGDAESTNTAVDGEQVAHLERGPLDRCDVDVHVDHVVEPERDAVPAPGFDDAHVDAPGSDLAVRMSDVAQVRHACLLQHRQVPAVVHDPHRVGLGEADPQSVAEAVRGGIERRFDRDAHVGDRTPDRRHRSESPSPGPDTTAILDTVTPAINELDAAGIGYSTREYEHDGDLHDFGMEAATKLGLDPDQVFKTLLVTADGDQAVAIVPVSGKLALKAVGRALGAKRVEMCDPVVAERITGYVRGGISPFGQKKRLRTVIDEIASVYDVVYVSGGKRGLDIGVAPSDLIAHLGAIVADIAAG